MAELFTFGESMVSFAPVQENVLRYVREYQRFIAGSESNVAIGVSKLGISGEWLSRRGKDEFGVAVYQKIRAEGVVCEHLIFDKDAYTGVMFKETLGDETNVFYYRKDSAASRMMPDDLDQVDLRGTKMIYCTGITPVLSESCMKTMVKIYDIARKDKIPVAFDPNIRRKLWAGKDYCKIMKQFALASQILLTGLEEGKVLFGVDTVEEMIHKVFDDGKVRYLVIKDGANGAWITDGNKRLKVRPYPCRPVDTVGAGDGFNAGFLAGILRHRDMETAGHMGAICGALATMTKGDYEGYPDADKMQRILENTQEISR